MILLQPIWLILIPLVLLIGSVVRVLKIRKPLRLLILGLWAFTLTDPHWKSQSSSIDLWVFADRSNSVGGSGFRDFSEWRKIIEKNRPSSKDRIFWVDYAGEVQVSEFGSSLSQYHGNSDLTKTRLALENAIARLDEKRSARFLVLSDGYATEPLYSLSNKLISQKVPVDYRLINRHEFGDFQIARYELPEQIQVNEPFLLGVHVVGDVDGEVPLVISREGQVLKETTVQVTEGEGKVEFITRLNRSGSFVFKAHISPEIDTHEGNNVAEKWVQVTGGPKVLLVTNYENDPLIQVLSQQNYQVEVVQDSKRLNIGQLLDTESVIFNNVPAYEVPVEFLKALPFYVNEQGGGFLMIGGEQSFAAGGYYESPVDDLLPVSMELKNDHRKLSVAMALVLDRSGSMSMGVSLPSGGLVSKMELANNGASEAINLMSTLDQVCLFAVDTKATKVIPLQTIQHNRQQLLRAARRVVSQGGGIYVYEALSKAAKELRKSPYSTRHLILFSDAADSVEDYGISDLVKNLAKDGITISVIGMGSESDIDAPLLKRIAKLGNGRIFFANDPLDIPQLFTQETVTVARSAFIKDPTKTLVTGKWQKISSTPMAWLPSVDGYNLSYARDEATVSLVSQDEYNAPLLAHWNRGAGRVATVSFPTGGAYSELARQWTNYGDMSQTLISWLNGDSLPPGLTMRHKLVGTNLQLDLFYDTNNLETKWAQIFAKKAPRAVMKKQNALINELSWTRVAPGHYSLVTDLEEGDLVRGVVNAGTHSFPFGPFKVNGNTEWKFSPERILELKNLSTQTQGRELIDLSKVWENEGRLQLLPLKWWLLILLLLLVLLEAWFTQTGYAFDWRKFKVKLGNRNGQSHLPQKSKILSQEKRKNIFARTRGVPESGPPKEEQNKASNNSSDHKKEEKAQSKSIDRSARFTKAKIKKDKS